MDIRNLDTRGSSKLENDRSPGPNGPRCPLPLAVQKWKVRDDTQLLDFLWEYEPALLIIESLELHTDDWTLDHVKKSRAALDKTDRRDTAQAMFALDKTNRVVPDGDAVRACRVAAAADATQAALTTAAVALDARQQARITTIVADAGNDFDETDRPAFTLYPMDPFKYSVGSEHDSYVG